MEPSVAFNFIPADETLDRLYTQANGTCLVALDRCLKEIRNSPKSYGYDAAWKRSYEVAKRMVLAVKEVGYCLPLEKRAS